MDWLSPFRGNRCAACPRAGRCASGPTAAAACGGARTPEGRIILAGPPNVGKSLMFNRLTSSYAVVSNYPGTSVDVMRGRACIGGREREVVDTPGVYSLRPLTEEERVTRRILMSEPADAIVSVLDAKNIERMLPLTLQLMEAGLPVLLAVNMVDEAERMGRRIDAARLEERLGIPVVLTACAEGRGVDTLRGRIESYAKRR